MHRSLHVGYEILLQTLERYFAHTEETDAQLGTLADVAVSVMLRVLKPLGNLITTLPVGPDHPGMCAGPSFELFYENDYLMPHREAAWALLEERLREAASFCGLVQQDASEGVRSELAPVEEALTEAADSLAAHFADRGATSRFAARHPGAADGPGETAEPPAADAPLDFGQHIEPLFREGSRVDAVRVRPLVGGRRGGSRRRDPAKTRAGDDALRRSLASRAGGGLPPLGRDRQAANRVAADGWRVGPIIDPFGQGWQIGGPVSTWPPA